MKEIAKSSTFVRHPFSYSFTFVLRHENRSCIQYLLIDYFLSPPPPPDSDEESIITIIKERWIFKLIPSPTTTPVLISYSYVKTKSLLKNIRKNRFLTLPFTVQFTKQERVRLPHIDHRGTLDCLLPARCYCLFMISSVALHESRGKLGGYVRALYLTRSQGARGSLI